MEFFLTLTFLFAVGALCGWVIELFFRRLNSKKWINPGFLHGPYLPLYGFGLVFPVYRSTEFLLYGFAMRLHWRSSVW